MSAANTPVLAAGIVCWRVVDGKPRVLLVHRTVHKDVSLPKGKLDPGEMLPETAVREIFEETGLTVDLGVPLGDVHYTLANGRDKYVHYWAAEVNDHILERAKFTPNGEISSLEWLSLAKARKKVSYTHDIDILDRFAAVYDAGNARTFAMIAVRHGKAVPGETWDGPDATRPLMHRGTDQAAAIAGSIAAFAPNRILSSTAARCLATITPLAQRTELEIKATDDLSQDAYASNGKAVTALVAKRLKKQQTAVMCSHGPVLPQIVGALAEAAQAKPDSQLRAAALLNTGDFSVLHFARDAKKPRLVAVETHES
ncbi:NUDIX domain-containing protein [Salinibacterium sp. NG22]|uniref:NUDIX hydrolase n=1 Tax=Salinibacterium sp. NG22 TaxID=2792040 RepID=UPI0018CE84CC|nr:NUDIX domain-containing protein [Salinibacterium sp. NG22]MBH0109575.1 NUDIX domain-containing protein [Salinibacterium sp. NG22]